MLENRQNCENCNKSLAIDSTEAMVCAFECTFCADCVSNILQNVCPNCGGGFERRPILPKQYRDKYPPSSKIILKPVDIRAFQATLKMNKNIDPKDR